MSEALHKMKVERAKIMALECYDEIKLDFQTQNQKLSDEIQGVLYKTLHRYAMDNHIETHDMLVIAKQLLLNMCAMSAEQILDKGFEESKKSIEDLI